jgi:hypothetical protein
MLLWFLFLIPLCAAASAQALEGTAAVVDRGSANIFRIILTPRFHQQIAALQWELLYRNDLRIDPAGVISGTAAEQAGKSVSCAVRPSQGATRRLACILAGGIQSLPAGAIAIVRVEAASNAPTGKAGIQLEKVVGVSPSLEPIQMSGTTILVTIR